jgi:hypothetical protein
MARTKFYTVDELVAEQAGQPLEERTLAAVGIDHPGRAAMFRALMAIEGMYPEAEPDPDNERGYAIERAELHRFVDSLAQVDLYAMHELTATLIREPISPDIYELVKRKHRRTMERYELVYADELRASRRRKAAARKGAATRKARALARASN